MNSEQLRQFKTIAECKNITMAAKRLYITQPALSTALKKLEDELGTSLFERKGRTLVITEAGERLLGYANRIIGLMDDAQAAFKLKKEHRPVRIYRIGATAINLLTAGCYGIDDRRLECTLVRNAELPMRVEREDVDLVIADDRYMNVMSNRFSHKTFLYHQQLVLSVGRNESLAQRDILPIEDLENIVMFGHVNPLGFRDWETEVCRDNNVHLHEEFRLDNVTYFAERESLTYPYLMSSFGVGSSQSRDYFRTRKNIPVKGKYTERDIFLWCPSEKIDIYSPLIARIRNNAVEMTLQDGTVWG